MSTDNTAPEGLALTDNEQKIADGIMTALHYAKNKLPEGRGKALGEYLASKVGELAEDKEVSVAELITAVGGVGVAIAKEAKAENVAELLNDATDLASDGAEGKILPAVGKLVEIGHDFSVIKKKGA